MKSDIDIDLSEVGISYAFSQLLQESDWRVILYVHESLKEYADRIADNCLFANIEVVITDQDDTDDWALEINGIGRIEVTAA